MKLQVLAATAVLLSTPLATDTQAQVQTPSPATASVEAIARLGFMRGVWVGQASGYNPGGGRYTVTQTERIGTLLDGQVLVIEGHGYNADGTTGFNAFGVVSWNSEAGKYEFRSYTGGRSGTFPFTAIDNGYVWEVPAGPGVMRYTADITSTTYHEVGDFVTPGQPPRRVFEMTLTRRGDTDWPAANPVQP